MLGNIGRAATLVGTLAFALCGVSAAGAATVDAVRVMLHPHLAAPGTLPTDVQARLETLAGTSLTLVGSTRTGALDLKLSAPVDEAAANALVRELRIDRGVLWARVEWPATGAKKGGDAKSTAPGRRLLMRVKDGVTPDWGALLARLSARAGVPVKAERQIGNVWVLSVAENQAPEALERIAALIQ